MELAQLDARRASLLDTTDAAGADLASYYLTIQDESPDAVAAQLRAAAPAVVSTYGEVAGTMAADWYEQTRPTGGFLALTADPPIADALPGMLGWALAPLFTDTGSDAITRLLGGVQRLISMYDRMTIDGNAARDPLADGSARIPNANPCAFCIYMSVAAGIDTGHYHDGCHCTPAPRWQDDALPDNPNEGSWVDAYERAYATLSGRGHATRQTITTKNIVALMRETLGTH